MQKKHLTTFDIPDNSKNSKKKKSTKLGIERSYLNLKKKDFQKTYS